MSHSYDLAIFVGRFQPFHAGHLRVVKTALERAKRLLVVVGSESAARRPDLAPFTANERREMIFATLTLDERARVSIRAVPDVANLTLWAELVRRTARETLSDAAMASDASIALVGCSKDRSSYYLRAFPQWASIDVPQLGDLSATPLRRAYFNADPEQVTAFLAGLARETIPEEIVEWLSAFRSTPEYADMVEEWTFVRRYRESWDAAPYPPTFVTADAVVVQGAHVLLIQRRGRPGKGLWALPGGFVDQDEFVLDAAVRELNEETGLQVPEAELRRSIVATQVFDAPFRDMRGRTITHATLFHLQPPTPELPQIVAADDAAAARWVPLEQLRREDMFSDHYTVIQTLTGLLTADA